MATGKKVNFMPCIQWLVHGQMTSYNETVYCQIQRVGNTAKTMMSNGKQFCEMLPGVVCDQSMQLKVA